jgi:hypothetical protein
VGQIDWEQGEITALGMGVPPANVESPRAAQLMARRMALVDAQVHLAEMVYGVQVSSETCVRDYTEMNYEFGNALDTKLEHYHIVRQEEQPDGSWIAEIGFGLFGEPGLEPVLRQHFPDLSCRKPRRFGEPERPALKPEIPEEPAPPPEVLPRPRQGLFTGLIIDARGLRVKGALSPKILRPDGRAVWDPLQMNRFLPREQGFVLYRSSLKEAMRREIRAGENPLVLRAIGCQGWLRANVVVSDEDADLILRENAKARFLERSAVIFVI